MTADIKTLMRLFLAVVLIAAVSAEWYYITVLRERIDGQSEEIRNISMQLQAVKNERAVLNVEMSSIKKTSGEKEDGNIAVGQR